MKLRRLLPDEVTFSVTVQNDLGTPVQGNITYDGEYQSVDTILNRVRAGDRYAWFAAVATATWKGFTKEYWRIGISFKDEAAFLASDTYQKMKDQALNRLNFELSTKFKTLEPLIEERPNA